MIKSLEDLEKEFILNEDMENESIQESIMRMLKFCKVDNNGFVVLHLKKMRLVDKIALVLAARYLACRLQLNLERDVTVKEVVSIKEIAKMLKEKEANVTARLKDLKDEQKVIAHDRGTYKIAPYAINSILNQIEEGHKNG